MARKEHRVSDSETLCYSGDSLQSVQHKLAELITREQEEDWSLAYVEVDGSEIIVEFMRPENERERELRERQERAERERKAKDKARADAKELEIYRRLHEKFGGKV